MRNSLVPIAILCAYIPFEDIIVGVAGGGALVAVIKLLPELVIYTLFAIHLAARSGKLPRTGIEGYIAAFFSIAVISWLFNGGGLVASVANVKALLRYLVLFYLMLMYEPTERELRSFVSIIVWGAIFQALLSISCKFISPLSLFLAHLKKIDAYEVAGLVSGGAKAKVGSEFGTFSVEISAAIFYLIAICFVASGVFSPPKLLILGKKTSTKSLLIFILFIGVFLTYKRFALCLCPILLALFHFWGRKQSVVFLLLLSALLGVPALLAFSDDLTATDDTGSSLITARDTRTENFDVTGFFTAIFTKSYWERSSESSRGWVLSDVGVNLMLSRHIFGFGPDPDFARQSAATEIQDLSHLADYKPLEDVYWVAILLYYGQIGLICFALLIRKLWRSISRVSVWSEYNERVRRCASVLIGLSVIYAFVVRIYELRSFSFYLFLVCGALLSLERRARRHKLSNPKQVLVNS